MNKKWVPFLFLIALLVPAVSADLTESFFDVMDDVLDANNSNDIVLIKLGLWVILFILLFKGGEKVFPDNPRVAGVIALVVAILAVRFMPADSLESVKPGLKWFAIIVGLIVLLFLPYFLVRLISREELNWPLLVVIYVLIFAGLIYASSYWNYSLYFPEGYIFYDFLYYLENTTWLIWASAVIVFLFIFRQWVIASILTAILGTLAIISYFGTGGYPTAFYDLGYLLETSPWTIPLTALITFIVIVSWKRDWRIALFGGIAIFILLLVLSNFYLYGVSVPSFGIDYDTIIAFLGTWQGWLAVIVIFVLFFYFLGARTFLLILAAVGAGIFYYTKNIFALIAGLIFLLIFLFSFKKREEAEEQLVLPIGVPQKQIKKRLGWKRTGEWASRRLLEKYKKVEKKWKEKKKGQKKEPFTFKY